jgi:alpha-tubulin suppressor-like RCC1 family protein
MLANSRVRFDEGARSRQMRLSSSNTHTCAVLDDGTVRCWGNNIHGEVGDGTVTPPTASQKTLAVAVTGLNNIVSVTAGATHTCALRADGTLWCWGDNPFGELGDGTTNPSPVPVLVRGVSNVVAVSAGARFTCAVRVDGTVWCWGRNDNGQLGIGFPSGMSLSPLRAATGSPATAISLGIAHACALLVGGRVQCWGYNLFGQLGDGNSPQNASFPTNVMMPALKSGVLTLIPLTRVVDISAGSVHTCALIVDGTVRCWGSNGSGELGNNSTASISDIAATVVVDTNATALTNAVALSAGSAHTCAILADGSTRCWGDNVNGQLGSGITSTTPRIIAGTAVLGLGNAYEIVTGYKHTCAIEANNWVVRCWGDNALGQLGNGTASPTSAPNTVPGVSGSIGGRMIHAFTLGTCARRGNDAMACWGAGSNGQLGNGSFNDSSSAVTVSGLTDVISFSSKHDHSCVVRSSGTVRCWGGNLIGQLGIGNRPDQNTPQTVAGLTNVVQVAAGYYHTCALIADGTVQCWGDNGVGQLAQSLVSQSLTPVAVANLSGVVSLSAGYGGTCAVIVDGTVRCWGTNVGDGVSDYFATGHFNVVPVTVLGLNNITAISVGYYQTCALAAIGSISCWGKNEFGEVGNSTTNRESTPDTVTGITSAVSVAADRYYTCAVLAEGSASCWGDNSHGQLAAKDNDNHPSPTPVIQSFTTVQGIQFPIKMPLLIAITTDYDHTCVLQGSGAAKCWGQNYVGQLGIGTTGSTEFRPVVVNSFTANVAPNVLVKSNGRIAEVIALMNCSAGSGAHIYLTLQQGETTGSGQGQTQCTGGQIEVPLTIPGHGPSGFQAGPATANVEAVVRDNGKIIEDQHWTRAVTITIP